MGLGVRVGFKGLLIVSWARCAASNSLAIILCLSRVYGLSNQSYSGIVRL